MLAKYDLSWKMSKNEIRLSEKPVKRVGFDIACATTPSDGQDENINTRMTVDKGIRPKLHSHREVAHINFGEKISDLV